MAKKTSGSTSATTYRKKVKSKRPGVHAKTKHSFSKKSKLWHKVSRGQGSRR